MRRYISKNCRPFTATASAVYTSKPANATVSPLFGENVIGLLVSRVPARGTGD